MAQPKALHKNQPVMGAIAQAIASNLYGDANYCRTTQATTIDIEVFDAKMRENWAAWQKAMVHYGYKSH